MNNYKFRLLLFIILIVQLTSFSQSIIIGDGIPDPTAILEIKSNEKGLLIPRMTNLEREGISNPAQGLQVYNTDEDCIYSYDGTSWITHNPVNADVGPPPESYKWSEMAIFPGPSRSLQASSSAGAVGFIGGGSGSSEIFMDDFYKYDPETNQWTEIDSFPGENAHGQSAFGMGQSLYVGLGLSESGLGNKFFKYDIETSNWVAISDFPGQERTRATTFTINNKAYVGLGGGAGLYNDFFAYDPLINQWSAVANFPGDARNDGLAFTIGNNAYVGGGWKFVSSVITALNDFYKYDSNTNTWTQIANFPYGIWSGAAFSIGNIGLVGTGYDDGEGRDQFYKYIPETDEWSLITPFIESRYGTSSFTIGDQVYLGLGNNGSIRKTDLQKLILGKYYQSVGNDRSVTWSPILKYKRINAVSAPNQGTFITLQTGLSTEQIVEANVYIDYLANGTKIPPSYTYVSGLEFDNWIKNDGSIIIVNHRTNSSQITNKPIIVEIIYQE